MSWQCDIIVISVTSPSSSSILIADMSHNRQIVRWYTKIDKHQVHLIITPPSSHIIISVATTGIKCVNVAAALRASKGHASRAMTVKAKLESKSELVRAGVRHRKPEWAREWAREICHKPNDKIRYFLSRIVKICTVNRTMALSALRAVSVFYPALLCADIWHGGQSAIIIIKHTLSDCTLLSTRCNTYIIQIFINISILLKRWNNLQICIKVMSFLVCLH